MMLCIVLLLWPAACGRDADLVRVERTGSARLTIAGRPVQVELATTPQARRRGLMHRTHLGDDEGMLFLFPQAQPRTFWMKDTLIGLDIVFLDDNGTVQNVEDAPPGVERPGFSSRRPCRLVLELRRGWCREAGLGVGDRIELPARLLKLPSR